MEPAKQHFKGQQSAQIYDILAQDVFPPLSHQKHQNPYLDEAIHINQQLQYALLASKKFYKKEKWARQIVETYINTNLESTTIEIHYGPYATQINLINFQYEHQFGVDQSFVGSGQFGKVFICNFDGLDIVAKMIHFDIKNLFVELKKVYKEYFIALIASQLKVGPKIINLFGYQLVFLKNYAIFGMELAQKFGFQNQSTNFYLQMYQMLTNSLKTLHSLHIVHRDIKLENILWSKSYQKYVFIDFGLSMIVQQSPSEKTLASFSGSFNYCSPQMKKLFFLRQPGLVDLYSNDLYAIKQCKKSLSSFSYVTIFKSLIHRRSQNNNFIKSLSCVCRIMKAVYSQKYLQARFLMANCEGLYKSILSITNKIAQRNIQPGSQNQIFEIYIEFRKILRQKIIANKLVTSQTDDIIAKTLQKNNINIIWSHLLLSKSMFKNFDEWSDNEMWLERVYLLFNPIQIQNFEEKQRYWRYLQIISQIYESLNLQETDLIIKKVRVVLLFFLQKFKKFKNKKLLQNLSDSFIAIKDYFNNVKTQDYILQITDNPFEYCLRCIRYHLKSMQYFGYQDVIAIYIGKFKQKILKMRRQTKQDKIFELMCQIGQKISSLELITFSNLQWFDEISVKINELQQLVERQKPQFKQIIGFINRNFHFIYFTVKKVHIKRRQTKKLKLKFKQLNKIIICKTGRMSLNYLSMDFYEQIQHKSLNFLKFHTNIDTIRQCLQFYFEMTEGQIFILNKLGFRSQMCNYKIQYVFFNIMLLSEEIKWLKTKKQVKFYSYFHSFCKICQIVTSKFTYIIRYQRKTSNLHQLNQYFQLLATFQTILTQKIQQFIIDFNQKILLYFYLKIIQLRTIFYTSSITNQQDVLHHINQITLFINNLYPPNIQIKLQMTRAIYFWTLALLLKYQYFKITSNTQILQDNIIKISNNKQLLMVMIYPIYIFSLINIRLKRLSTQQNFHAFEELIFSVQKYENYYQCKFCSIQITKAIKHFIYVNSRESIKLYVVKLTSQQQKSLLNMYLQDRFGCFMFLLLLEKSKAQMKTIKKYFYKISHIFNKMSNRVKIQIISTYFYICSCRRFTQNKRKNFIYLKFIHLYCYAMQELIINTWQLIKKIILKRSKEWPHIVRHKLKQKLYYN